ncbi:DNA repair protein RecN [Clostridium thermobutyricum]|uniref:DNA repair protein RecN n=1 Tax=Clostridium thermobutyricum DSM 4928 TaxID=1121339 RepID=A0A1V4SV46_9CLOT|nr:DNA repair protein RecN [Clostridium thermobutyricum]OPX47865.1 DNA repair protein RecN [Clostridium thermobutyricum DSM 4928]
MLIQLTIKNFALIESISFDLGEGFNILSGETGAGKSILIDAIDYVLGGKFSKDLIRTGENKTSVEAVFEINNNNIKEALNDLEIEYEDVLIIRRETLLTGKSLIKVNGKSLIVSQLKKIREKILDIHGQHQNQNLLQKESHGIYLDNFIGEIIEKDLNEFSSLRDELYSIRAKIVDLRGNLEGEKLIDYIKFQLEDIEKGKLRLGEEEELKEQFNSLSNAEKINNSLTISYNILSGGDSSSALEGLSKVITELSSIEEYVSWIKEKKDIVEEAYYNLEEITRELRDGADNIQYDEEELAKINERLYTINSYKKKYGGSVESVLENYENLKNRFEELSNAEEIIKELEIKEKEILEKMKIVGEKLHKIRVEKKDILEEKILNELSYVGLDKSTMEIQIEKLERHNERGFDDITFAISTNPGEPVKSLEKVLSGGELSRIMLALKCVFADKDDIPTLIFDEIDTGISGQVGQRVGEKMYQVSKNHQVLCITHLPQIAILSDKHYFVSKEVINGKTYTKIKILNEEEKISQVASMLGGDNVTNTTIENVKEMLKNANLKKEEIKSL